MQAFQQVFFFFGRTIILKSCILRKTVERGEVGCLPHRLRGTHSLGFVLTLFSR